MKKIAIILSLLFLTNSAFAGSCPMMAQNIDSKIEEAQKLRDAGVKAHEDGKHAESEKLLNQALQLFKSQFKSGFRGTGQQNAPKRYFPKLNVVLVAATILELKFFKNYNK